tara:strand:+ start:82 stop:279 length:198 start_codon:yes stop_codon:yes gene_type:complete
VINVFKKYKLMLLKTICRRREEREERRERERREKREEKRGRDSLVFFPSLSNFVPWPHQKNNQDV